LSAITISVPKKEEIVEALGTVGFSDEHQKLAVGSLSGG
jgi:ATPase subunit of ABC transporter with duplicated ATPase domains